MKHVLKRVCMFPLMAVLSISLTGGALAYTTPDFTDVAQSNWAYTHVMKMADAGVIKGTGGTTFSPELKVSPAMWLTLVGRAVYEADARAAAQAGDSWYDAYVRVAQAKGLLVGTDVTAANMEGEITRYDMAITLYGAVKLLGAKDATVDTAKITDYGNIPTKYASAVGQVYAQGLITGDGKGNFNGADTMRRDEAATVMSRLIDLKVKLAEEPTQPEEPEKPSVELTGEMTELKMKGSIDYWAKDGSTPAVGANLILYYKDGTELGRTVTGKDGRFELNLSVDKAYYDYYDTRYYIDITFIDPDGAKYSNMSKRTGHSTFLFNLWEDGRNYGETLVTGSESYIDDF